MRTERHSTAGFTLVELLVSLAIMVMTAGLLMAGLGSGRRVWETVEARTVAGESIDAAQAVLRERLEHVFAATRFDATSPYIDVRGDARQFSFFAPALAARQPDGLMRFRIALDGTDALTLYSIDAQTNRVDPAAPSVKGWAAAPLIGGVAALDIDYFGVAPPDNTRRWRSFWYDRPTPPELVRVRVRFANGDRRVWPDLVVRPVATVGNGCRLDRTSGACRSGA